MEVQPAPDRWSIAECAEHVVTMDDMTFGFVTTKLLKMPADEVIEERGSLESLRLDNRAGVHEWVFRGLGRVAADPIDLHPPGKPLAEQLHREFLRAASR